MPALMLAIAGFALVVAFCVVVWWPSALLVAGLILLAAGAAIDLRTPTPGEVP